MRKIWMILLAVTLCLLAEAALGETGVTAEPSETAVGGIVDVTVRTDTGAAAVIYTLEADGKEIFRGKEDGHFSASFRPRQEGEYTVTAQVVYEDGRTENGQASVLVSGTAEETQSAETVYSQKDGWWKNREYGKSELDNAGCAIFTLSHALLRMGWTGDGILPENLAQTYRNCYTKNGTAVARLVYGASQEYGYTTSNALVKEKAKLRDGLKNGDYYSFAIVLGHIALMTGIDGTEGKVRVVDSAPSATFERIRKGKVYFLRDGEYVEAADPGEIPGARYYFETRYYGGLEYYMDLEYCARRGGRLIRPTWLYYRSAEGKTGALLVSLGSGESEITVGRQKMTVATRDLSWGENDGNRLAVVNTQKAVRMTDAEGKRIASIPARTLLPVTAEAEGKAAVIYKEQRGFIQMEDLELTGPLEGEIRTGAISVNGNTSGRASVKMRYGPSEKERVAASWKTGTRVTLVREENDFWLAEGRGVRLWVHRDYVTEDSP